LLLPPPLPLLAEPEVDVGVAAVTVTPVNAGTVPDVDVVVPVVWVLEVVVVVVLDVVDVDDVDVDVKPKVAVLLRANCEVPSVQQPEPQQYSPDEHCWRDIQLVGLSVKSCQMTAASCSVIPPQTDLLGKLGHNSDPARSGRYRHRGSSNGRPSRKVRPPCRRRPRWGYSRLRLCRCLCKAPNYMFRQRNRQDSSRSPQRLLSTQAATATRLASGRSASFADDTVVTVLATYVNFGKHQHWSRLRCPSSLGCCSCLIR
jgi:hypothetical protein